jgi:hypothetical protein
VFPFKLKYYKSPGAVAHAYNPSYLGGWNQEDHSSRPAWANSSQDPHLQNNQSKMDWRCGSSGRAPALQERSTELKTPVSFGLVAHTCNPSYSGASDQEDCGSKPDQAKQLKRPYHLKKNPSQQRAAGVCGSRCRPWVQVPVLQKKHPKSLQSHQEQNKTTNHLVMFYFWLLLFY